MGKVMKSVLVERDAILTRVLISQEEYAELKQLARADENVDGVAEYIGNVLRWHIDTERTAENVA